MHLEYLASDRLDPYGELFRADFDCGNTGHDRSTDIAIMPGSGVSDPLHLKPLIAIARTGGSVVLVSGFRRLAHATAIPGSDLPVLVYHADEVLKNRIRSELKLHSGSEVLWLTAGWILALLNLDHSTHTPLEMAGLLGRASRSLKRPAGLLASMCPSIVASEHRKALIEASSLRIGTLKRLSRGRVDIGKASLLSRFSSTERPLAILLTTHLIKLSQSRLRRFEELVRDTALRRKMTVHGFLRSLVRNSVLSKSDRDASPVKDPAESFMEMLETMRAPEKHRKKSVFDRIGSDLRAAAPVQLSPPNDFEGDFFAMTIRIRTESDLEQLAALFQTKRGRLIELLRCVTRDDETNQGNPG